MYIGPNLHSNQLPPPEEWTIEEKVEVWYGQIYGWHLHIAHQMVAPKEITRESEDRRIPHSEFAALQIVMSYFETIGKYWYGYTDKYESRNYFRKGFYLLLNGPTLPNQPDHPEDPKIMELLDALYDGRNSLYHSTSGGRIKVGEGDFHIFFDDSGAILINVRMFILAILAHLENYRNLLLDPTKVERREKFEARFNFDQNP